MQKEDLYQGIRENKIASTVVLLGTLNAVYSITVNNWLGLLLSAVVIILGLSEVLEGRRA